MKKLVLLAAAALAGTAAAQDKRSRDPVPADAPVPPLRYQSPLAGFRPMGEDKSIAWRQANHTVATIGGWRTYAREAQQPAPAPQPAAKP
jgi:hypothetical protein